MSDPFNDYSQNNETNSDYQPTSLSCSVPILSILATVFGWIGGIIIFFLEKQNVYVRAVALQSFIINGIVFMITLFFLIFYWAGLFFVVCFWIMFVVAILVIIILVVLAFIKAKSGVFLGVPFLDKWILKIANH
ncbi:hypothetical protein EDI_255220 [Entamoeba dispar SAW760]|uniref:DUF4870 domain-containing protein n=1 Tax=Entamoeba dispar (strain ATCC PRA-260 / SAW760) TaxID=370354 RepID=B0EQH5_ENTDS|nr:uncharacterized protein EDI_255220 [Entamoeba dispar SAW760]EDR23230.1 hypothetical protein EDI_255220 [Entamoeba dispar SAW760]|eukprot:EDR23230.1 hypothetical protein EDI_255220 [Entamoeba dispar SAW760]